MDTSKVAQEYRLAQWTQVIQSRLAEGTSIDEFCEEKGISRNVYFYWQRKVREAACGQLAVQQSRMPAQANHYSFAEVRVERPRNITGTDIADLVALEYKGVRVSIRDGYPPEKVAAIIRELARP